MHIARIRINGMNALMAFTGYSCLIGMNRGEYTAKPRLPSVGGSLFAFPQPPHLLRGAA